MKFINKPMNTKMKINIKSTLTALAMAAMSVAFTSCNDLLDMPSYTDNDTDFVFSNEHNAEIYVKGCYRGLVHEEQYRQYNTGETTTIPTEENLTGSKFYISNYKYDPLQGPFTLSTTYSEGYRIIEACNLGLKNINQMPQSQKRDALLAELYFIRAYAYHGLIRFYGDVPAVFTDLASLDRDDEYTFYPKRASRDMIYDHIIQDMQDHVEALPWYSQCDYGTPERLTRQAAYGVMARICLHAAGYSLRWGLNEGDPTTPTLKRRADSNRVDELYKIADDALLKVINQNENHLIKGSNGMTGFQYLFFNYCQRNYGVTEPEMMWHLAQLGTTTSNSFGYYNDQPGYNGGFYGDRKCMQVRLPNYYLSFDPKDERREVTCCNYTVTFKNTKDVDDEWSNIGIGYSSIGGGKFRIGWAVEPAAPSQRNIDVPMLRYSDILLMRAETQNYLFHGPTPEAKDYLFQVRDRAGVGHLPIPEGEDEFLDAIMQERKWELAGEFVLRSDLIRTNLLDKNIRQCQEEMKALAKREGKYADAPVYRLYKYAKNAQKYGDSFLALTYIDITDQAEINLIKSSPDSPAKYAQAQANALQIAKNHGYTDDGNPWYVTNLFLAWGANYNKNWRMSAGFSAGACSNPYYGLSMPTRSTLWTASAGFPDWIDGPIGLFFAYEPNKTELFPLANMNVGHPMVDNPNLSQLPGYE